MIHTTPLVGLDDQPFEFVAGQTYWLTTERRNDDVKCWVYSDPERTRLVAKSAVEQFRATRKEQ